MHHPDIQNEMRFVGSGIFFLAVHSRDLLGNLEELLWLALADEFHLVILPLGAVDDRFNEYGGRFL
jgi:hypothetical protein